MKMWGVDKDNSTYCDSISPDCCAPGDEIMSCTEGVVVDLLYPCTGFSKTGAFGCNVSGLIYGTMPRSQALADTKNCNLDWCTSQDVSGEGFDCYAGFDTQKCDCEGDSVAVMTGWEGEMFVEAGSLRQELAYEYVCCIPHLDEYDYLEGGLCGAAKESVDFTEGSLILAFFVFVGLSVCVLGRYKKRLDDENIRRDAEAGIAQKKQKSVEDFEMLDVSCR